MIDALKRLLNGPAPQPAAAPPAALPLEPPTGPNATVEDVRACFRLLLGRAPNPEEWSGHAGQAGQALPGVVAGYLNSLEFARRDLFRPDTGEQASIAERGDFRMFASAGDALIGRHVLAGGYEPEVEAVFRRLLRPGMGVVDIGANIGFFTMVSAAAVGPEGFVLAIEPNPANARMLEASRRLNGFAHVVTAQVAAGRQTGMLVLNTTHSNGTTSDPAADLTALLHAQTVACVPVDALLEAAGTGARRIDLIKIDVEGAEYNALLGATRLIARDRPAIISEFSPDLMPGISGIDGPGYLRWLCGLGYQLGIIQSDGGVTPEGADVDAVMAEYVRRQVDHIDVLATPL